MRISDRKLWKGWTGVVDEKVRLRRKHHLLVSIAKTRKINRGINKAAFGCTQECMTKRYENQEDNLHFKEETEKQLNTLYDAISPELTKNLHLQLKSTI